MKACLRPAILILAAWLTPIMPAHTAAAPDVLVTIKPLHSLVSGLLDGITQPQLLIEGYQSPHTFQLRPGDADKIDQADIIIWIGPAIETPLRRIIGGQTDKLVIQLIEGGGHGDEHGHGHHGHGHGDLHEDPHRWLDPVKILEDIRDISRILARHLPDHADAIQQNLQQLSSRLQQLDRDIQARLPGPQTISGLLYHDAWGHFLERYQLETHGIINPHVQTSPGARHLHDIDKTIRERQTRCLLVEPQFRLPRIESLKKKYQLQSVELDPLGADLPAGADTYFIMMNRVADAFAKCL